MSSTEKMVNVKSLKKFARLYFARKKLKEKTDEIQKQLDKMEPVLLNHLKEVESNTGLSLSTLSLEGGLTFTQHEIIYAKFPKGREEAAKVLKETGFKNYVAEGFNSTSVSALLRELSKKNEIPKEFKGIIDKNPKESLRPKIF